MRNDGKGYEVKAQKYKVKPEEEVCAIDLEVLVENDEVFNTTCHHVFHWTCIKEWLDSQEIQKKRCPICLKNFGNIKMKNKPSKS